VVAVITEIDEMGMYPLKKIKDRDQIGEKPISEGQTQNEENPRS
jgi:hypothetical protein